jgi:hypothetical protein
VLRWLGCFTHLMILTLPSGEAKMFLYTGVVDAAISRIYTLYRIMPLASI